MNHIFIPMKTKKIKQIAGLFIITVLCTACPRDYTYENIFFIKNNSSQILHLIKKSDYSQSYSAQKTFFVNETAKLFAFEDHVSETDAAVAYFFIGVKRYADTLFVYAADSVTLLKTWVITYDTASTDKQFYRESDWSYKHYENVDGYDHSHQWTFTITDEDLQ